MTDTPADNRRLFSGIQPTGIVHIGNWLGAIQNWVALQQDYECIFSIVDHHATTVVYEPEAFREAMLEVGIALLAAGIDPERSVLFVQSMVPEHTELAWIFSTVTMYGELGRMTQFKDKSEQHQHNVNVGLFTYPVLQAADILLYKAGFVPVGEDQLQHLELAREVGRRWNRRFDEGFFPEPKALLTPARRVLGTDGQSKMSKSMNNYLGLLESPDERWAKLKDAFTDPQRLRLKDPGRPEVCNVFSWHGFFSSEETIAQVDRDCRTAGIGCFQCKQLLADSMEARLGPMRERAEELRARPDQVWEILHEGGRRARAIARQTLTEVRELMGLPGAAE
ncbi:MAG: tryptophan--tRNA ligase [Deltaproteobacteria bacterium]|nr:tryptophan--tRNA ligase [Deltaproteobacteria bacterium]